MSNTRKIKRPGPLDGQHRIRVDGEQAFISDRSDRFVGAVPLADIDLETGVVKAARMSRPGLNGTLGGCCIACIRPTDTALALAGCMNFMAAALAAWGIPVDTAANILDAGLRERLERITRTGIGEHVPVVLDDDGSHIGWVQTFTVCGECAGRAHMTPGLAIGNSRAAYYESALPTTGDCDHPLWAS